MIAHKPVLYNAYTDVNTACDVMIVEARVIYLLTCIKCVCKTILSLPLMKVFNAQCIHVSVEF